MFLLLLIAQPPQQRDTMPKYLWKNDSGEILRDNNGRIYGSDSCCCTTAGIPQTDMVYASGYRRIYDGYTGPLITIERKSDGATMNVYPLSNGDIDEAGMANFIGSDTARVKWLQNQVDPSKGACGSTSGMNIISNGSFYRRNGHPTPYFDGNNYFGTGYFDSIPFQSYARTIVVVAQYDSLSGYSNAFSYGNTDYNYGIVAMAQSDGDNITNIYNSWIKTNTIGSGMNQFVWRYDADEQLDQSEMLYNASNTTITSTYEANNTPYTHGGRFRIGSFCNGYSSYRITGWVPEVIIYSSSVSVTELYNNQAAYWGI